MAIQNCYNCGQIIGNLQEPFSFQGNVVCKACKILLGDEYQTIGIIDSNTETETPETPSSAVEQATPLFLYIPVSRLILMSIVSFGLYEAYWIYKNWRYVKERDYLYMYIRPFWRAGSESSIATAYCVAFMKMKKHVPSKCLYSHQEVSQPDGSCCVLSHT